MPKPQPLSAADRRRFAPVVAEVVDHVLDAADQVGGVEEFELLVCQAAVRFQYGAVPGGAAGMLVDELAGRGTDTAMTVLSGFATLCAATLAEPAVAALAAVGAKPKLPAGFGDMTAVDVRRADLLRAQLWTLGIQRAGTDGVQLASVAIEHDGRGPFLARGLLSGPLGGPDELNRLRPAGVSVEHAQAPPAEAAEALVIGAARNRELGFPVPYELAVALPLIATALGLQPGAVTDLYVAPEGERLWAPPEDEEAFSRIAGRVLEDFVDWGTADGRPRIHLIDRSGWRVGAAMFDYAYHANDGALGRWSLFDLVEFFLRWVPEEETFTHEEMRDAPDAAKELLFYLASGGLLASDDDLQAMIDRCEALRPDFEEAFSDRSSRGLAQSLIMQMREEGLDPTDPTALQSFMDDFNARPFEERDMILGPPLDMRLRGGAEGPVPPAGQRKTKRRSAKAARKRNRR